MQAENNDGVNTEGPCYSPENWAQFQRKQRANSPLRSVEGFIPKLIIAATITRDAIRGFVNDDSSATVGHE